MGSEKFETAEVTFKIIQRHWQRCHSIGHLRFLILIATILCICLYFASFPRYYHISKN